MRRVWVIVTAAVLGLGTAARAGLELVWDPETHSFTVNPGGCAGPVLVPSDSSLTIPESLISGPINLIPIDVSDLPLLPGGSLFWFDALGWHPPELPGGDGIVYIPDIDWEGDLPVPEPVTAVLMGLGGIGLLKRRRGGE